MQPPWFLHCFLAPDPQTGCMEMPISQTLRSIITKYDNQINIGVVITYKSTVTYHTVPGLSFYIMPQ